ncbi:serine/threonine protein kinase [Planoprotostelium fungivorum]|uniref:Serine/threonine protein kinase n=1 Tax=Planoprotostelium fungivorum TaxID=1890364 RepID=A0A2P6MWY9_9EUKA|nr:serine/threonine protein kinase [Planoprotostelium fungivorum]PRP76197.1 serine/threonine protein kinase [Planoprotostelium fungivorum]
MLRSYLLLLTLSLALAQNCDVGFSFCAGANTCYNPTQYVCSTDKFNGQEKLCAAGTFSCNNICVAECGYQCNADGSYTPRANPTCPTVPQCGDGSILCGTTCHDSSKFCCVSGFATPKSSCPKPSDECIKTSPCPIHLSNVGTLFDGQLRLFHGAGATEVNFTLTDGELRDDRGQICYISASGQLQCNFQAQTNDTNFCISNDILRHSGGTLSFACDTGTGGSNIYDRLIDSICSPLYIHVEQVCPSTSSYSPPPTQAPSTVAPNVPACTWCPQPAPCTWCPKPPSACSWCAQPPPIVFPSHGASCPEKWNVGGVSLPNPFLHFSFDLDLAAKVVSDDSGNGRDGTIMGLPIQTSGVVKAAISFDASVGLQAVQVNKFTGLGSNFTLATWLKLSAADAATFKIASTRGTWNMFTGWDWQYCPLTKVVSFSSGFTSTSWKVELNANVWTHLAVTADSQAGQVTLFVNGQAGVPQSLDVKASTGALSLAGGSVEGVAGLSGCLDDFVVFDVAMDAQQIELIKNNGCPLQ